MKSGMLAAEAAFEAIVEAGDATTKGRSNISDQIKD